MFLVLLVFVAVCWGDQTVFSVLSGFFAAHASAAVLGGVFGLVEIATPWMTRAARVRRGARLLRSVGGRVFGRPVSQEEAQAAAEQLG